MGNGKNNVVMMPDMNGVEHRDEHSLCPLVSNQWVAIDEIDTQNEYFRFRSELLTADLAENIQNSGLQYPIIVRPSANGKLQVVCGFRRLHAVISLGWKKIPAMVRTDLNDDLHALQTSVLENEQRQSYSSVERAYAMVALKNSGYSNRMLSSLFRVGKRQLQRLCKLTTFPESLQSYVAEGRIPLN